MTGKEYLKDLLKMDTEIKSLLEEVDLTRQAAEGLRSMELSDMPKGGKGQDMGDVVATLVDLQNQQNELNLKRMLKQKKAMCVIAGIEDKDQRQVLIDRYINGKSWEAIVNATHYSYATVFRLHGAALQSFDRKMKDESK